MNISKFNIVAEIAWIWTLDSTLDCKIEYKEENGWKTDAF